MAIWGLLRSFRKVIACTQEQELVTDQFEQKLTWVMITVGKTKGLMEREMARASASTRTIL